MQLRNAIDKTGSELFRELYNVRKEKKKIEISIPAKRDGNLRLFNLCFFFTLYSSLKLIIFILVLVDDKKIEF